MVSVVARNQTRFIWALLGGWNLLSFTFDFSPGVDQNVNFTYNIKDQLPSDFKHIKFGPTTLDKADNEVLVSLCFDINLLVRPP